MNTRHFMATALLLVMAGAGQAANADTRKAICEFHNHGDLKRDRTGPCTFTEHSDRIEVKLANGKTYRFMPEEKRKGHYVDQDGNRAAVKREHGYQLTYQWKNQRLLVMLAE